MLSVEVPVVAHQHDDGLVEDALFVQRLHDSAETLVDRDQHSQTVADGLVRRHGALAKRREAIDATFERGLAARRDTIVVTTRQRRVRVQLLVPFGGNEAAFSDRDDGAIGPLKNIRMERFVGQHEEEGTRTRSAEKIERALGEDIRYVAGHAREPAVFEELRIDRLALTLHSDPDVEARPRRGVVAHVPLPDEAGVVTAVVQLSGKGLELMALRTSVSVVEDAVVASVEAGQDVGATRRTQGRHREHVLEHRALTCEAIDVGSSRERMARGAEVVEAEIIDHDEQHVRSILRGDAGDPPQERQYQHERLAPAKPGRPHVVG